jgi:hypothetical protein
VLTSRHDVGSQNAATACVYSVGVPIVLCSPRTRYSRMEWPVCWQCGGVSHIRRNCWWGYPTWRFTDKDWPRLEKQLEETDKMTVSSLLPTCYVLSMLGKGGYNSLNAKGWIGERHILWLLMQEHSWWSPGWTCMYIVGEGLIRP